MTRTKLGIFATVLIGAALAPWSWAPADAADKIPVPSDALALLAILPPISFDQLMAIPEMRGLAGAGGSALMTTRQTNGAEALRVLVSGQEDPTTVGLVSVVQAAGVTVCRTQSAEALRSCPDTGRRLVLLDLRQGTVTEIAPAINDALDEVSTHLGFVVAASPHPSASMLKVGDEVCPVVLGFPRGQLPLHVGGGPLNGRPRALTSDTTRETGLVSNIDVAPTVLDSLGLAIPTAMDGAIIRQTTSPAPFALHRLELEQRRTRLPIQFAELAFVVVAALIGAWALVAPGRGGDLSPRARAFVRTVCLAGVSLQPALLLAGALPYRSYVWMVPSILVALGVLTAVGVRESSGPDPVWPFTVIGAIALAILAVNLTTQGLALRVPLFGGTMFDGVRFYGLPNAFLPVLLGGAVFVAAATSPFNGFAVLVAAGLAAGFPSLGADLGGSITLFFAAGLWLVLRTRPRVGLRELATIAVVTVAGSVVVVAVNRWAPGAPTHVGRFVEEGSGVGGAFRVLADHLAIGARMIADVPAAVLPLIGFVLIAVLVVRRTGSVGEGMRTDPRWPAIVVTICAASLVAYLVNDTGAAAADPAFVYAMAGITYPAVLAGRRRTPTAPARTQGTPVTEVRP
ncbi:MAG TPA: hypothetical protein VKA30_05050 [Actinomycetota bacterium]|nr:hypothetical protein [Actinomycetota bacterium]